MASWTIPAGHVAGVAASWQGRIGGRTIIDLNVRWKKGSTLEPNWVIEKDGWAITVEGLPTVNGEPRLPPAAGLPGRDDRRVHGDRPHHHRRARAQRHPRRRRARHPASSPTRTSAPHAAGLGANVDDLLLPALMRRCRAAARSVRKVPSP